MGGGEWKCCKEKVSNPFEACIQGDKKRKKELHKYLEAVKVNKWAVLEGGGGLKNSIQGETGRQRKNVLNQSDSSSS